MAISSLERTVQARRIKSGSKLNAGCDTCFRLLHRKIKAFRTSLPPRTSEKEVSGFNVWVAREIALAVTRKTIRGFTYIALINRYNSN